VQHPIPGNDDSARAVRLVVNLLADAIIKAESEYALARARAEAESEAEKKEEKPPVEAPHPRPRRLTRASAQKKSVEPAAKQKSRPESQAKDS